MEFLHDKQEFMGVTLTGCLISNPACVLFCWPSFLSHSLWASSCSKVSASVNSFSSAAPPCSRFCLYLHFTDNDSEPMTWCFTFPWINSGPITGSQASEPMLSHHVGMFLINSSARCHSSCLKRKATSWTPLIFSTFCLCLGCLCLTSQEMRNIFLKHMNFPPLLFS